MKYLPFVLSVFAFTLTACDDQNNGSNQPKAENPAAANMSTTEEKAQPANKKQDAVGQNVNDEKNKNVDQNGTVKKANEELENQGQQKGQKDTRKRMPAKPIPSAVTDASKFGLTMLIGYMFPGNPIVINQAGSVHAVNLAIDHCLPAVMKAGKWCHQNVCGIVRGASNYAHRLLQNAHADTLRKIYKNSADDFRKALGEEFKNIEFEAKIDFQELVLSLFGSKEQKEKEELVRQYMESDGDLGKFVTDSEANVDNTIKAFLE